MIKKNHSLYHQGNKFSGPYCISEGKIKLTSVTDDGRENIREIATNGDILGIKQIIQTSDHHQTATPIENTHVCSIDGYFFQKLTTQNQTFTKMILKKLCDEINHHENNEIEIMYSKVKNRIALLLTRLQFEFGIKNKDSIILNLELSRTEMASMLGIAGETLIRFLTEFKDNGIIEQKGKMIVILNLRKLEEIANERF